MCNYKYLLSRLKGFAYSTAYGNYSILGSMYSFSKFDWMKSQSGVWDEKYRLEMTEFIGRSGFGFSFNMLEPEKMFNNR